MKDVPHIRQDYMLASLDENIAGDDPLHFFTRWFQEAQYAEISEVNAMTLATIGADNTPNARIVLLKGLENGAFVFFTNYLSNKGENITHNNNVCLVFFWKELERQVRIKGKAEKLKAEQSDEYFLVRPHSSRLGAWASPQSKTISDRSVLDENYRAYEQKFGDSVPRPPHWGGYAVEPVSIEFWQGRSSRMHDRILFSKDQEGNWTRCRLAP